MAKEYFIENYPTMADIVLIYGDKKPISVILLNVYEFRKLEAYGYSLEDLFMDVYTSVLEAGNVANPTVFIRTAIEQYLRKEICNISYREFVDKNIDEISLWLNELEFRRNDDYSFDDLVDRTSTEEIDGFINDEYIDWIMHGSHLTERERELFRKNILDGITLVQLRMEYGAHQEYRINKAIRKVRYFMKYRMKD